MKTKIGLLFLALLFVTHAAFGFEFNLAPGVTSNPYLRWDTTKGPVKVGLSSSGPSYLPVSAVQNALQRAMNSWQSISGQSLAFQYQGSSSTIKANNLDDVNSIIWVKHGWAYSKYTLAVTRYSYYIDDAPHIVDSDILLNAQYFKWGANLQTNEGVIDVQEVLLHELGHMVGFAHSSYLHAVMFPYLPQQVDHTLSRDEIAGFRFLYGSRPADFRGISPLNNSCYVENMAKQGLPLPMIRWSGQPSGVFNLDFSASSDFRKAVTINAGRSNTYTLTAANERTLLALSSTKTIYWRVRSGSRMTSTRLLRFRPIKR